MLPPHTMIRSALWWTWSRVQKIQPIGAKTSTLSLALAVQVARQDTVLSTSGDPPPPLSAKVPPYKKEGLNIKPIDPEKMKDLQNISLEDFLSLQIAI